MKTLTITVRDEDVDALLAHIKTLMDVDVHVDVNGSKLQKDKPLDEDLEFVFTQHDSVLKRLAE